MIPILRSASAGTLESSDVYVEIAPAENGITIDLNSVVQAQFGDEILAVVREVLSECGVENARVSVQDRGALRDMILHTDSYYIGCDYTGFELLDDLYRRYIPIEGVDFTLNTMWVKRIGHTLTQPEQDFLTVLEEAFAGLPR